MRFPTLACALLAFTACASTSGGGSHYVAMGSSFASGPGVLPSAGTVPARCGRSAGNYAQQLARLRGLDLTDVTCSGAKTAHVLGPWGDIPAQLEAISPQTRLVTLTIGGNDIGYIGGLLNASCAFAAPQADAPQTRCRPITVPTQRDYIDLEASLMAITAQVRQRAPKARLIFVNYAAVLPPEGVCPATPLMLAQANASRAIASRLEAVTAKAAQASGAELLDAASITRDHHACAPAPWMQGYAADADWVKVVPYHPTKAGMTAIAEALSDLL